MKMNPNVLPLCHLQIFFPSVEHKRFFLMNLIASILHKTIVPCPHLYPIKC